jgi:hypothetical protein
VTTVLPRDPSALYLDRGGHESPEAGMCLLEAVSYVAGEPFGDHPECVSPVIAAFGRRWNDALSDEDRNRLLRPLIPLLVGTRTTPEDEEMRAWMAVDWLARVHTPAFLRLAGLEEHARALESLARIADATTAGAAQPRLNAAGAAAWAAAWAAAGAAARDAAWDAAGAAARDAAWDAAGAAAWAAAGDAAGAAARDAAWDAAGAAAGAAAWAALQPTVLSLQVSATALMTAMCDVGRTEGSLG